MPASYTDVIAAHRKTLDSLAALAYTTIEVSERLLSLNLQTTRRFVNDAVARNQALRGTGDRHEALAVYAAFSQPWLDRVLTYSRRYHDILAETHTQLVRASEACTAGRDHERIRDRLEDFHRDRRTPRPLRCTFGHPLVPLGPPAPFIRSD